MMEYQEVIKNARGCIGPYCKACPVCNGAACRNTMPGPGAKGIGDLAMRNYQKWQEIRINMDTICEQKALDTEINLFGKKFAYPFFAGPVGAVKLHYGDKYTDCETVGSGNNTGEDGTGQEIRCIRSGNGYRCCRTAVSAESEPSSRE